MSQLFNWILIAHKHQLLIRLRSKEISLTTKFKNDFQAAIGAMSVLFFVPYGANWCTGLGADIVSPSVVPPSTNNKRNLSFKLFNKNIILNKQ